MIYSRDEAKQFQMSQEFNKHKKQLRFFIGDVRDRSRLSLAFRSIDYVIHAYELLSKSQQLNITLWNALKQTFMEQKMLFIQL